MPSLRAPTDLSTGLMHTRLSASGSESKQGTVDFIVVRRTIRQSTLPLKRLRA